MRTKHTVDECVFERVAGILASIDSPDEMRAFLKELLTPGEVRDITLRWRLLERLSEGVTQRRIAQELRISLCKITRGSKILKQQGAVTTRLLGAETTGVLPEATVPGSRLRRKQTIG